MVYRKEDNNLSFQNELKELSPNIKAKSLKKPENLNNNNIKILTLSRIGSVLMINIIILLSSFKLVFVSSWIKLTINKIGENIKVYNPRLQTDFPTAVKINDIDQTPTSTYKLTESTNIIKLAWNCDTTSFTSLFSECTDIEEIDFTEFSCSSGLTMSSTFYGCKSLTFVNIPRKIYASKYTSNMFSGCSKLKKLDLSKLDVSKVEEMFNMFRDCSSLTSLILPNLNKTIAKRIDNMFSGCSSLTSLDLKQFNTSQVTNMLCLFCNCTSLISLDLSSFIINNVQNFAMMFFNCSKLEYINLANAKINISIGFYYDVFNYTQDNLVLFSYDETWQNILFGCKININCLYDSNNNYTYIIYKRCEYLNDLSDNICKICEQNYNSYIYSHKINLFFYCEYNNKTNHNDITDNTDIITYINNNNYNTENINEIIRKKIEELIHIQDKTSIDQGIDEEYSLNNILITLTTTKNQKNNEYKNRTSIDLNACEYLLKKINNISNSSFLYIIKLDIFKQETQIPFVEYEVYFPLYDNNELILLDISICKKNNMKADISIPVQLKETIEMHNSSSDYYNDLCSKTTSNKGTDIILKDRRDNYVNNNMSLCEPDCELIEYNYTTNKSKCSCDIKIKIPLMEEIRFNKEKLLKSFLHIKNFANIELIKCYKVVFKIKSLVKNYGFYINIFIFILFFICLILFYMKSLFVVINYIDQIVKAKNDTQEKNSNDINISINKDKKSINTVVENIGIKKIKTKKKKQKLNTSDIRSNKSYKINKIKKYKNFPPKKKNKGRNNKKNVAFKENEENLLNNEILKYKDNELNSLKYELALIYDKRTCSEYYLSLVRTKHLLIFSFYIYNSDYNSKVIKMFLFFFTFSINLTINAFFFDDDNMHKIYKEEGSYNFIYQLPPIIYSTLITSILLALIKFLSLSENSILEIKQEKNTEITEGRIIKEKKCLKIKFAIFFVISFIILFLFIFYISCFCGVYENTQIHLIKDTVSSFALSLIYPFGIYLVPCLFRIPALKAKNKDKKWLYKFSTFVQLI